jgi:hypothetical protein
MQDTRDREDPVHVAPDGETPDASVAKSRQLLKVLVIVLAVGLTLAWIVFLAIILINFLGSFP